MVNPGTFRSSRREFLLGEKSVYAAGVANGYAADALAAIQRRYFKRYPIDLPLDEEPTQEFLANVDDDVADEEPAAPDETLSPDEYKDAMVRHLARGKLIEFRKSQIKRWLAYQYMKDNDMSHKVPAADNPYHALLHQLAGTSIKKPRIKLPVNIWRKTQKEEIEAEVRRRLQQTAAEEGRLLSGSEHKKMAGIREKVVREFFGALSEEEREHWSELAREDHETSVAEWKKGNETGISTTPESRQKCIGGLIQFAQPILDIIAETTGWKATLITGGPEPAHGGRLNIISLHSGTTSGDIKLNFGRSERLRYQKFIVPIYGDFLRKCYSPEECRSRALPDEDGLDGAYAMDLDDDGVNFDSLGIPGPGGFDTTASPSLLPSQAPCLSISIDSSTTAVSTSPHPHSVPRDHVRPMPSTTTAATAVPTYSG